MTTKADVLAAREAYERVAEAYLRERGWERSKPSGKYWWHRDIDDHFVDDLGVALQLEEKRCLKGTQIVNHCPADDPYQQGWLASMDDSSASQENPYPVGSHEYAHWELGRRHGEEEDRDNADIDDDEPITREWVNEVCRGQLNDVIDVIGKLKLFWDGSLFQLFIEDNYGDRPGVELPHIRTRGQLRQLLEALGWQGEEKG